MQKNKHKQDIFDEHEGFGVKTVSVILFWGWLLMGWGSIDIFPGATDEPVKLHQQGVSLAREGKYEEAIALLEKVLKDMPTNRAIIYDFITVLSWAGEDERALEYLKMCRPDREIPAYVLSAAAQSARRLKRYDLAIELYRQILEKQPDYLPPRISILLNEAEKGNLDHALEQLLSLKNLHPRNIDLLLALAYIYQLRKEFFQQMVCFQEILDIEPGNRLAAQGLVLAVSAMGAPNLALEMLAKEKNLELSDGALEQIKGDRAAQLVQWGELTPATPGQRHEETDAALQMLEENARRTAANQALDPWHFRRALFDRLIALRDRFKMKEIIALYNELNHNKLNHNELNRLKISIPYYSLIPVADAFLYQNRPRQAKKLYQEALQQKKDHFNTLHSLFYAYLESENYGRAGRVIENLAKNQPDWFNVNNSGVYGENSRKLDVDLTAIMFQAYSCRLKKAQAQMENKMALAPFNRDIRTKLGKIHLWQGRHRKALELFNLVLAQEPAHLEALIWRNHALLEYHKPEQAEEGIRQLQNLYPEEKAVQKLVRDWDTRHMWHFHAEINSGQGKGWVLGNRDFYIDNYLYTPPVHYWARFFLHYHNHWAKFFGDSARYQRWGAGIDFNRGPLGGQIEIMRQFVGGPDYGFRIACNWRMDDYWELSTGYTYNSIDIPLKGRFVGLKGNSAELKLAWNPGEQTQVKGGFITYDFNDNNRRNALFFSGNQKLLAGPHFLLATGAEVYTSTNSLGDRYYFNPGADASYMLSFDAWWLNYRNYDFKFAQRLVLAYGSYWQKNYHRSWLGHIRYEHQWDFNDREALIYGISYSRRVYDGNPEYGTIFYVTINWRF